MREKKLNNVLEEFFIWKSGLSFVGKDHLGKSELYSNSVAAAHSHEELYDFFNCN